MRHGDCSAARSRRHGSRSSPFHPANRPTGARPKFTRIPRQLAAAAAVLASLLVVAALPVSATNISGPSVDDLSTLFLQASKNDPQLAAAREQLRATRERLPQARAALLPQIGADASIGYTKETQTFSAASGFSSGYQGRAGTITVTQPVFDKQAYTAYDQVKTVLRQASLQFAASRQDLVLRVSDAYFKVLGAQDNLRLADAELAAIKEDLNRTRRGYQLGTATLPDVNDAKARYDQVNAQRITSLNALNVARDALQKLVGRPVSTLARLRKKFEPIPLSAATAAEWSRLAESDNLQVRIAQEQYTINEQQVQLARDVRYPKVSLVGQYQRDYQGDSRFGGTTDTNTSSISLDLSVPLFTSGATSAKIQEAAANKNAAYQEVLTAKQAAAESAESSFMTLESGLQQIQALEQALDSARISLASTRRGRQLGLRTTVDVLNAEQQLYSTARDLAAARYTYLLTYLQLETAVGGASDGKAIRTMNDYLVEPASGD